eukprot:6419-Eustigmatos_ZCMA.PRE.1
MDSAVYLRTSVAHAWPVRCCIGQTNTCARMVSDIHTCDAIVSISDPKPAGLQSGTMRRRKSVSG